MNKVLLSVALLSVMFLGNSCDVEEQVCERDCAVIRDNCKDKALTVIGRNACDKDYDKCIKGCQ